ncbi:MAG: NERD domain-containing protein [Actinomycetes bacterium]
MQPGESAGQQSQRRLSHAESLRTQAQLLNERADRIERSAEMWDRGHAGEQTVGAQLELLRPYGFDVLHDVRWPGRRRANIDHVAIGPPGILVVDAKNWSGNVTVNGGVLRQNGYLREREVTAVRQAGRDVASLLQLPWALHVIPVISLAAAGSAGVHRCQDVTVVGHGDLVPWATRLPHQLTPGDVLGIASHLRGAMPSAAVLAPRRQRTSAPRRRPPREPSARQRQRAAKRAARRREDLTKLIVAVLLLLALPSLLTWWGSHGTAVVRAVVPTPTLSAATPTPSPSTPAFANCAAMRVTFPYGVRLAGARNQGAKLQRRPVVNDAVYRTNTRLDRDRDGVVCELARAAQGAKR